MEKNIRYINQDQWEQEVLQAKQGVVVDFYSSECPPCEALAAKYESLASVYGKDVKFIKIFRQENRELAESLNVKGSPTVLFYKGGQQTGKTLSAGIRRASLEKGIHSLMDEQRALALKASEKPFVSYYDILIIGAGPAGLTAAIYAAQAKMKTVLVDRGMPGGNVSITHQVSNYPGFVAPQPGFMLSHYMTEQAKEAGAEFRQAVDISSINLRNKEIVIDSLETIHAKKIILSTGSSPRPLNIPGEQEYKGKGVSYCATCDAKYYEGKHVVIIGGGNTAIEEALFIDKFTKKITVIHQFDKLQANKTSVEKAMHNPNIEFFFKHEPRAFIAQNGAVNIVEIEDLESKERRKIECDGVFVFVGMVPNLDLFEEEFDLDDWGYLNVDDSMRTNIPDVFATGDVIHKQYRQITTAVADGTIAAIAAARELE